MSLTAEQIQSNWEEFLEIVESHFEGERKDKLLAMYNELEDRASTAPASSVDHYHNAFIGGYIDHVLRVIKCAKSVYQLWSTMGADMSGYTEEELIFVAMHHDLGKLGFPGEGNEVYQPNDSEWHIKNQGKIFKINSKNPFGLVNDVSLWLLQHYDIKVSFNEMLAIRCTDGLYDEANRPYFISRTKDSKFRTNLPFVMHQADSMAARIEFEIWAKDDDVYTPPVKQKPSKPKKAVSTQSQAIDVNKMFGDLFGD
tara:strand:+ start:97 stop:861 length:765 start_codon:yes stop_codon:yes gene_type:complete